MSRNGSGTYTLPAGNPVVTGTTISSTWANNTLTDISTALTGSLASDGQTTATGNLKMGNNRVTGLADGIAATDAATVNQIPSGALFLLKASNLSDVANASTSRTNLGLGTIATQAANAVAITGGTISGLSSPLPVASGGTGAATLTANNVLLGNGTSAPQVVAPSTTGNVLTSDGTTWVSSASLQYVKAWINYKGTATVSIRASFNVSSVTVNGTGDYTINMTNALVDANYAVCLTNCGNATSTGIYGRFDTTAPTSSAFRVLSVDASNTAVNSSYVMASVFR